MQVEAFLEVATLDISVPLTVVLDGGATIFPASTAVDFFPEVHRRVAGHWCVVLRRQMRTWQHRGACATDGACAADRKHDCYTDGWRCPSRCGVLMAAMMSWLTS
jgi:hypothetical protein